VSGGADRAIQVSTAAAVLGVAGIAAYVSYQHAFEVVRAHGESGLTARLEPATIDGLVYSSSMVVLYAARHRLPVPALARWLLALGIVATLAANVANGWPRGAGRRRRRGLARRQPRRKLRAAAVAHPDQRRACEHGGCCPEPVRYISRPSGRWAAVATGARRERGCRCPRARRWCDLHRREPYQWPR